MNLSEINALVLAIEYEFFPEQLNLIDYVFNAYNQYICECFERLFQLQLSKNDLISQFETILKNNWDLIKGTAMCYTALPDGQVTQLLVGVAKYLEQESSDSKSAFEYLMPGVAYEFTRDGYPNLNTLDLADVLRLHILGEGGNYLIPVRLLLELDLDPTKQGLDNPYFEALVHDIERWIISRAEMKRLYSHSESSLALQKAKQNVENYVNKEHHLLGRLRRLCKSLHLGSLKGNGNEMDATEDAYEAMFTFMDYFNKLYARRLITLSKLPVNCADWAGHLLWVGSTRLFEVGADGHPTEIPVEDIQSFKTRLRILKKQRTENKNDMLLNVLEWDSLCQDTVKYCPIDKRISPGLRHEILTLYRMTTQVKLNLESHENTESCIMKRRENLGALIQSQAELLASIHLETTSLAAPPESALLSLKQEFEQKMRIFSEELLRSNYQGRDALYGYPKLIRGLKLENVIDAMVDLEFIHALPALDIHELYREFPILAKHIPIIFQNINELVFQLLLLPPDKIVAFLTVLQAELAEQLITSLNDFLLLVKLLDAETCGEVIEKLYPHYLSQIDDIRLLHMELELGHFRVACARLKPFIVKHLTVSGYCELIKSFTKPGFSEVFQDILFSEIQGLVKNSTDYCAIKSTLVETHDQLFYDAMFNQMHIYVQSADEFEQYLSCLQDAQKPRVIENFKEKYFEWVHDAKDLSKILRYFNIQQVRKFSLTFLELLTTYLATLQDYANLLLDVPQLQDPFVIENCLHQLILDNSDPVPACLMKKDSLSKKLLDLKPFTLQLASASDLLNAKKFTYKLAYGSDEEIKYGLERLLLQRSTLQFFHSKSKVEQVYESIANLPITWKRKVFCSLKLSVRATLEEFKNSVLGMDRSFEQEKSAKRIKLF